MGLKAAELVVRPCVEEQGQVMRPRPNYPAQFFGLYRVNEDGTEEWIADCMLQDHAKLLANCLGQPVEQHF